MMKRKDTLFTKTVCNDQKYSNTQQALKIPAGAVCVSCAHYEMYRLCCGWCNILRQYKTNSDPACSDYR